MTEAEEVLDALTALKPGDPAIFTNKYGSHDCVFVSWHPKNRLTIDQGADYMRVRFVASKAKHTFTAIVRSGTVQRDRS